MDPVTIARLPKCSAGTVGNPNVFGIDSITWLDSATTHEFCRDSHNETGGVSSKSPAHQVSSDPSSAKAPQGSKQELCADSIASQAEGAAERNANVPRSPCCAVASVQQASCKSKIKQVPSV